MKDGRNFIVNCLLGRGLPMFGITMFLLTGCGRGFPEFPEFSEVPEAAAISTEGEAYSDGEKDFADAESIAAVYEDICREAAKANVQDSLEVTRRIVAGLGEKGYVAVDSENQVDMAGAGQVAAFCKAVEENKKDKLTILQVTGRGFRKFDLQTEGGEVNIIRGYYQYGQNGHLQNRSTAGYRADVWQYTEEGYLIFEGNYFSEENYVLTLSGTSEHTALRVMPLDEKCREWNRKYLLPVGYGQNNLFLCDWTESDYGDLDLYDIFDKFYPVLYGEPVPYGPDADLTAGTVYMIPEEIFEKVIMTYFNIDTNTLRSRTNYSPQHGAYEYRPRSFYEAEYPDIPYPEVVGCTENPDGTVSLMVHAVYPYENTSVSFSHETVLRLLGGERYQHVSNRVISEDGDYDIRWHSGRLTEEERETFFSQ